MEFFRSLHGVEIINILLFIQALDENSHLTFILNNLNEILEILAESGKFKYHDSNSDFLVIRLVCNYS